LHAKRAQGRLRIHHQPDRRHYYTDLGPLRNFSTFNEQQHNLYAVVDFKIERFDVNAG